MAALEKDYKEVGIESYEDKDEGEEQTATWSLFTVFIIKSFRNKQLSCMAINKQTNKQIEIQR